MIVIHIAKYDGICDVDISCRNDLNNDYALYKDKVLAISEFHNMIPVISVKEEINPETKFMEIEELNELQLNAQIILINSPRKLAVKNGEYEEQGETALINNSARIVAADNQLAGYGDYCGLKDLMPMNDGSKGTGASLALVYDFHKNVFYSYSNHDTSLGIKGYYKLIPLIKKDEKWLNPSKDCPGFEKIKMLSSSGTWNTWHHINAVRYIFGKAAGLWPCGIRRSFFRLIL